jgi:hypothetical protein
MYQFVFELRDASGTQVIARANAMYSHVDAIISIETDVTEDTLWTNNNAYFLNKTGVYVGGDPSGTTTPATLTIEPGTFVLGSRSREGMLAVTQGSKMIANGTSMLPIVFTSELTRGNRAAGDWGGLVLNGFAPINLTEVGEGEGNSGPYGGNDPYDSSGVLNYVRVEFAGIRFSEQNELNGIAFQGVGAGTQCSNIQVLNNQDDGVEFFGGTVNCENVFLYNNEDDSVDWTDGWTGYLRNVVVIQNKGGISDNGIEADSNEDDPDAPPVSKPKIYNATFIGSKDPENGESPEATQWRRGTGCIARNFLVMNFRDVGIRVDGAETCAGFGTDLVLTNSIYYDNGDEPFDGDCGAQEVQDWFETPSALNRIVNPMLADPTSTVMPNVTPLPGSPALDARYAGNSGYIGGVDPNDPWIYEGWTTFIRN